MAAWGQWIQQAAESATQAAAEGIARFQAPGPEQRLPGSGTARSRPPYVAEDSASNPTLLQRRGKSSGGKLASHIGKDFTSFLSRGQPAAGDGRKEEREKPVRRSPEHREQAWQTMSEAEKRVYLRWIYGKKAHPASLYLKQWFASWAASTGVTKDQIRFSDSSIVNFEVSDSTGLEATQLLDAFFVVQGVEVLIKVTVANLSGGGEVKLTAEGATTKCRWEIAAHCVTAAVASAVGLPLEEMLSALLTGWHAAPDEALGRQRRHSVSTTSEELPSSCFTPRDVPEGTSPSRSEVSVGTSVSSRPYMARESLVPVSAGESFRRWLTSRPPLLRFQSAARGLAWDYPLSRVEKHELLLLQLFSQEAERQAEIKAVRRRSSVAPSSIATPRPLQHRSLRGCRSMSSAAF
jgi:hypothetical protein